MHDGPCYQTSDHCPSCFLAQDNLKDKPVYARSGWEIPEPDPRDKPQRRDIKAIQIRAVELAGQRQQECTIRSVSPHIYNCVGMIFASRRVWIEIDHIYRILHHDGYRPIQRNDVMQGDVVLYKQEDEPAHVAVVLVAARPHPTSAIVDIKVLSKWGLEPIPRRDGLKISERVQGV